MTTARDLAINHPVEVDVGRATHRLGDVTLSLAGNGQFCHGIAAVDCLGIPLRCARRPLFVDVRTPHGERLIDWRAGSIERDGERLQMQFHPRVSREAGSIAEWMCHEVRPCVSTSDWTAPPKPDERTFLTLELAPAQRRFGDRCATGLSYRYRLVSDRLSIYRLLDRGTWEPGGRAVGSSVWMRGCGQPIADITDVQQHYSTEWYLPGAANPNVYQFFPLQTHLQGFTFTANEHGVLITWATEPSHIRTLIQKPRGVDEIEHWHEHCGDLTDDLWTAPMEVLFIPGAFDRAERINLYEAVREQVWAALHAAVGIRQERVKTFGYIEEWGPADLDDYRRRGLPKLRDAGVQRIGLANHFQNNMNVLGVANMCCTLDLKVADSVGADQLAGFCREAREAGIDVEMWGNTALSTLGMQLARTNGNKGVRPHPCLAGAHEAYAELANATDPWVRNPNGGIDADHYTPVFATLNLRDQTVRTWWLQRWAHARREVGLNGIFLDSSFNLSSDKFHFRPNDMPGKCSGGTIDRDGVLGHHRPAHEPPAAIHSQYMAHLQLVRAMQELGYSYSAEDTGVFGVSRCGATGPERLASLFMWTDCIGHFDVPTIQAAGLDPDEVFFQALAFRMMWMISWDPRSDRLSFHQAGWRDEYDSPTADQLRLIRAYNTVEPSMLHRTVLGDERGVLYEDDRGGQVLWSIKPMPMDLAGPALVHDVLQDSASTTDSFQARALSVYRITPIVDEPQPDRHRKCR